MYIQRTRGSKTSTNEGRARPWCRPRPSGTREHPRNHDGRGSTARDISKVATDHHDPDPTTKVGRIRPRPSGTRAHPRNQKRARLKGSTAQRRLATSARSRSPLRRATTTTDLMHPRKTDDGPSTQWTDHHDPDPTTKKVGRISPSPLGHPGAPTKSTSAQRRLATSEQRSRSPLRRATTTTTGGRRRGRRGRRWPRLARPRPRRSGTREHAERKEGDKSADRGLRLNRSRQQGRSTAYTTLIQLRGLRRI